MRDIVPPAFWSGNFGESNNTGFPVKSALKGATDATRCTVVVGRGAQRHPHLPWLGYGRHLFVNVAYLYTVFSHDEEAEKWVSRSLTVIHFSQHLLKVHQAFVDY